MSYESERKELYEALKDEFAKANQLREREGYHGKDGPATMIEQEAIQQYNASLVLLKKKYKIE